MNNKKFILVFLIIMCLAVIFRCIGLDWDEGNLLHPDERFLVMVEGSLKWVGSFKEYFNTEHSTMNPHNQGFGFYVYGTLPLFIIKGLSILGSHWPEIPPHMFGRYFSVACDLGTVILVFLIANALKTRKVALFAMFLSACSVLQIQHAHFGVVDSANTFFVTLSVAIAIYLSHINKEKFWKAFAVSILFGLSVGCSAASKVNSGLVCIALPLALLVRSRSIRDFFIFSISAGCISLVAFRFFQPYAFAGPGFFSFSLNPRWLANIQELSNGARPSLHFPPAVQWFDRGNYFGIKNLIFWGMGLFPGLAAIFSLIFWWFRTSVKRDFSMLILLTWTTIWLVLFGILPWVVSLRYLMPVYPCLYILIAACVIKILDSYSHSKFFNTIFVPFLISTLIIAPLVWALAFISIYRKPHTRVAASHWILKNIPGPVNLIAKSDKAGTKVVPLAIQDGDSIVSATNHLNIIFSVKEPFTLNSVKLPKLFIQTQASEPNAQIKARLISPKPESCSNIETYFNPVEGPVELNLGCTLTPEESYTLNFETSDPSLQFKLQKVSVAHETSWDDGLPLRVDGYDPYGGIYEGKLNFEMYWDDNQTKVERIASILMDADYIFITSNRQWGTTGRLPEYYPVAQRFYRELAQCPQEQSVFNCYARLEAQGQGGFGYEVMKTFVSYPELFGYEINDQYAEEAFSVYDHPKVILFKKKSALPLSEIKAVLESGEINGKPSP